MRDLSIICTANADLFPNWENDENWHFWKLRRVERKLILLMVSVNLWLNIGQENVSISMSLPWKCFKSSDPFVFLSPCQSNSKSSRQNRASIDMGSWMALMSRVHVDLSHTYSTNLEIDFYCVLPQALLNSLLLILQRNRAYPEWCSGERMDCSINYS